MTIDLDNLISSLEILTPLAKALPEPVAGPLEGSLETLGRILKYTKEVKANKEEAEGLANVAVSWAEDITNTLNVLELNTAGYALLEKQIENFRRLLVKIADRMNELKGQSWTKSVMNKSKDAGDLAQLRQDLRTCFEQFMTQSELRVQAGLNQVQDTVNQVSSDVKALLSNAERDTLERTKPVGAAQSDFRLVPIGDPLEYLKPVGAAKWDSRFSPTGCLPDTRVDLIQNLIKWYHDPSTTLSVYWLTGLAGTGKSTIAKSFCERVSEERRDPQRLLFTLVYDLARTCDAIRPHVVEALSAHPDIGDRPRQEQIKFLLTDPLAAVMAVDDSLSLLIVIDALDESSGTHGVDGASMVHEMATALKDVPAKLLVTSRAETVLAQTLQQLSKQIFKLHEIDETEVGGDVKRILTTGFEKIELKYKDFIETKPWPRQEDLDTLVARTGHLIVYATTVIKYVGDGQYSPEDCLKQVLGHEQTPSFGSAFQSIDLLYLDILVKAARDSNGHLDDSLCGMLRRLLGVLCFAKQPMSVASLSALLNVSKMTLRLRIGALSSVLLFSSDSDATKEPTVRIFHQSFQDFVTNRCKDSRFFIDSAERNAEIAIQCLRVLNKTLRQDICNIRDPTLANAEVKNPDLASRLESNATADVQYASIYWVAHIQASDELTLPLLSELEKFTSTHILHWVELLSLLEQLPLAIASLSQLKFWFQHCTPIKASMTQHSSNNSFVKVEKLLSQTLRALQVYDPVIRTRALHIYHSMQLTMPECELLNLACSPGPSARLVLPRATTWPSSQLVLQGHSDIVNSVAFSPDGTQIVSGSSDESVRIWDSMTGRLLAVLEFQSDPALAHKNKVYSLSGEMNPIEWTNELLRIQDTKQSTHYQVQAVFTSDGSQIVSWSKDGRYVRTWNILPEPKIDACLFLGDGHEDRYHRVAAVASDGTKVAYITTFNHDYTKSELVVWDLRSRCQIAVFEDWRLAHGQSHMTFTTEGSQVAIASQKNSESIIEVYEVKSQCMVANFVSPSRMRQIYCIAFSPNNALLAACCGDDEENNVVRVWDVRLGCQTALFHHDNWRMLSLAFSPDGSKIVSGDYRLVRIWDVRACREITHFEEHNGTVMSVAFSPDGTTVASGSGDNDIRLWDVQSTENHSIDETLEGHGDAVTCIAFSLDNSIVASGSEDNSVRIWYLDPVRKVRSQQLKGHSDSIVCVSFSSDGMQVASAASGSRGHDQSVRVWDVKSGKTIASLESDHYGSTYSLGFSPNGTRVVGTMYGGAVLWAMPSGTQIAFLNAPKSRFRTVEFSHDARYAVLSNNAESKQTLTWDVHDLKDHGSIWRVWRWATLNPTFEWVAPPQDSKDDTSEDAPAGLHNLKSAVKPASSSTDYEFVWDEASGWIFSHSAKGISKRLYWIPKHLSGPTFVAHGTKVAVGGRHGTVTVIDMSDIL